MSRYILANGIKLRSWRGVPAAFYYDAKRHARSVTAEQLELLKRCDGKTDIPDTDAMTELMIMGVCYRVPDGEAAPYEPEDFQLYRHCDNTYFRSVYWMITGKCNLNCLHCFNAADNAHLQSEWSLDEAMELIRQADECGVSSFTVTGGEPMVYPHLMTVLKEIYRRGMVVEELNTNGLLLTQEILDEMKSFGCMPRMKISFDGIGFHDWMRNRKGIEAETLEAIKRCADSGFEVMINCNVHRRNIGVMEETAKLLDSLGVSIMRIIRTTEVPRWRENAGDSCLTLQEYYDGMIDFLRRYKESGCKMRMTIWQLAYLEPEYRMYATVSGLAHEENYRDSLPCCANCRSEISIGADGQLFPCIKISGEYYEDKVYLGNAKKDGLQKHLQGGEYLSQACCDAGTVRKRCAECAACEYFKICLGGCRTLAYIFNRSYYGAPDSSKCVLYKQGYHQRLIEMLEGGDTPYTLSAAKR